MTAKGTYVYCLVSAVRQPTPRRGTRGLPGTGPVRLLGLDRGLWIVVADAPMNRFSEASINRRLSDLDWVSRCAVAHEAVVESFIGATAILPMKLFTIFNGDDRALGAFRTDRKQIDAVLKRVKGHQEWGVRVTLDRARATARSRSSARTSGASGDGASYLTRKKVQRDAAIELAEHAQATTGGLYDRLSSQSRLAKRRTASELPVQGGPLLLDAAFLVPKTRAARFRSLVGREARTLARAGYHVTLTGPWPPYTFVKD